MTLPSLFFKLRRVVPGYFSLVEKKTLEAKAGEVLLQLGGYPYSDRLESSRYSRKCPQIDLTSALISLQYCQGPFMNRNKQICFDISHGQSNVFKSLHSMCLTGTIQHVSSLVIP